MVDSISVDASISEVESISAVDSILGFDSVATLEVISSEEVDEMLKVLRDDSIVDDSVGSMSFDVVIGFSDDVSGYVDVISVSSEVEEYTASSVVLVDSEGGNVISSDVGSSDSSVTVVGVSSASSVLGSSIVLVSTGSSSVVVVGLVVVVVAGLDVVVVFGAVLDVVSSLTISKEGVGGVMNRSCNFKYSFSYFGSAKNVS